MRRLEGGEDGAVIFDTRIVFGDRATRRPTFAFVVAGEVGADLLPRFAEVVAAEKHVGGGIKPIVVVRRKEDGKIPLEAVFEIGRTPAHGIVRPHAHFATFAGRMIHPFELTAITATKNGIRIVGFGDDITRFTAGRRRPVERTDGASSKGARKNPHRAVVLLTAEQAVGEGVVGRHAVHLRGGLVALRRPGFAAVDRNHGAAVVGHDHPLVVVRIDPKVVVVAVLGADAAETFAAVFGVVELHVHHINPVFVGGIGINAGVVPGPLAQVAFGIGFGPGSATIARTENAAVFGFDNGIYVLRVAGGYGNTHDAEGAFGQPGLFAELGPGIAAVAAFPERGTITAAFEAVRRAQDPPEGGIKDARIVRVHGEVDRAGMFADIKDLLPGCAAILGAENAAFFVGPKEVTERGDINEVGIFRMCPHAGNVAGITKADVFPGFAGIGRLPHAVAMGNVAAHGFFAGADINHVVVPGSHLDSADRAAEKPIRNRSPTSAGVFGLPNAAAGSAKIERLRLPRNPGHRRRAATPKRPDLPPGKRSQSGILNLDRGRSRRRFGRLGQSRQGGRKKQAAKGQQKRAMSQHRHSWRSGWAVLQRQNPNEGCPMYDKAPPRVLLRGRSAGRGGRFGRAARGRRGVRLFGVRASRAGPGRSRPGRGERG